MTTTRDTSTPAAANPRVRAQYAERLAWLEAVAAEAATTAAELRAELELAARAEAAAGCTPSWRVRGIGGISGRERNDSVRIVDPAAFTAWVAERHPEHMETVVRKAYADAVRKAGRPAEGGVVDAHGELVPGLEFVPGGTFMGIAFTVDEDAKQVFAIAAGMALEAAMRGPGSPFAADMEQAAEASRLLSGETPGHDEAPE